MANVSVLTPIAQFNGTFPASFAAGSNRVVAVSYVCYYAGGNAKAPTSCAVAGTSVNGTFVIGDTVSQPRVAAATFFFFEADLATIAGKVLTPAGHIYTQVAATIEIFQDAEQAVPTNKLYARGGGGSSNPISFSLPRSPNSFTVFYSFCQNTNYTATLTNPSATGMFAPGSVAALTHGRMADSAGTVSATTTTTSGSQTTAHIFNLKSAIVQSANINGGSPVKVGQVGISASLSGFTSIPTSVTCTYSSGTKNLTCSNIVGNSSAITFNLEDRSEGVDYPYIGDNLTFTITNGTETTVQTSSLAAKTGETVLAPLTSVIDYWDGYLPYHWKSDGFTSEGGEFVYVPYGDLTIAANGEVDVTTSGTLTGWFRPATGTGAGNVYYYQFTINDAGAITIGNGVTSKSLTSSALTSKSITQKL